MVNNEPMLILGGELSNSAATSKADIDSVLPRMKALGLNTVFLPAYWDLMEPTEGQFDFSLIDEAIQTARQNNLKLVYLWFGAWKNSMSCYAPLWFKQDTKRFPRAQTANGKPLEIATAFSENVLKADKRAFLRLVEHIKEVDSQHNTVIMLQVENEIGMLESARDFSPLAEKAYRSRVPEKLLKHLGIAKRGTWPEVFGDDLYAQEKFQAYYYAAYVQQLCAAAKATYALAPLRQRSHEQPRTQAGRVSFGRSAGPSHRDMEVCRARHRHLCARHIRYGLQGLGGKIQAEKQSILHTRDETFGQ